MPRPATAEAVVLVAVKHLRDAKTRLAPALAENQRAQLTLAMLSDVLEAVRGAAWTRAVVVITADPQVVAFAASCGAVVLDEPAVSEDRLNAAFRRGDEWARDRFPTAVRVALHGDLPALRAMELQQALCAARGWPRSYAADHEGSGTTALFAADPNVALDPSFGPDSAARHAASGAHAIAEPLPGLRQDVDVIGDVRAVAELGLGLATKALLAGFYPV